MSKKTKETIYLTPDGTRWRFGKILPDWWGWEMYRVKDGHWRWIDPTRLTVEGDPLKTPMKTRTTPTGQRISWLDSCDMPARIHRTEDEGYTTVCGHKPTAELLWKITTHVPRKMHGQSRYCARCFKDGGKTLPWYDKV